MSNKNTGALRMPTRRSLAGALGASTVVAAALAAPATAQTASESTFERVRRTGVVRMAVLPGEVPFFRKDLATGEWHGTALAMARDIAGAFNAKLEYVESTYSNSVLDLQANKIDLAFALNPTPQRALAIGFARPYYQHPFGIVSAPGFKAHTWDELNRPEVRVVSLIGSLMDNLLARYAPKATLVPARAGDDAILLVQAGRADCISYALIQALGVSGKVPALSQVTLLDGPRVELPSAMGVQAEPDRRWRDFLDSWTDYNRGTRQIGVWFREGLLQMGVKPENIPANADI
jgi:polar amino acid transport system substrate-binding protein